MTAAAMTGKAAVTATVTAMTAAVAAPSGKTTVESAAGIAASGESPVDVTTIHITAVYITAMKAGTIPSFKEGPIMGIVIVIPVVAIPGGVVIVCIAREFISEVNAGYHAWGRGIFILVNGGRCRFCVDLGLAAGSDQTGGYYCGECKERFHNNRVFKLGEIVLLYKKAVEVITYMTMC
jgi:hypothetical protein